MKRRNAIQLIAIGAAAPLTAQHAGHAAGGAPATAELRFFSPAQNALVDCIAEMILPADERSGGAHAAKVSLFIDDLLADSEPAEQKAWTEALAGFDAAARKRFNKLFIDASAEQRDQILAGLAEKEDAPRTELERFFVKIKRETISGYYTSRVGLIDELEYKGGGPIAEYPLCKHPEHTE
jgi:hypothetical protein